MYENPIAQLELTPHPQKLRTEKNALPQQAGLNKNRAVELGSFYDGSCMYYRGKIHNTQTPPGFGRVTYIEFK